jgi:hypothetical protein
MDLPTTSSHRPRGARAQPVERRRALLDGWAPPAGRSAWARPGGARLRVVALVASAAFAVVAATAGGTVERLARSGLEQWLSGRLGAPAQVGAVRIEAGGAAVHRLRLDGGRRGVVEVERLDLRVHPLRLARGAAGSIRSVRLAGVSVEIPLDAAADVPLEGPSLISPELEGPELEGTVPASLERPEPSPRLGHRAGAGPSPAAVRRLAVLSRRVAALLAEDATVVLERGAVIAVRAGDRADLVRELSAEWRRGPGGALSGRGRGEVAGGGLEWAATLAPGGGVDQLGVEVDLVLDGVPFAVFLPMLPALPWHRPDQATVSGRLAIARGPDDGDLLPVETDLVVRELGLDSPRLAEAPVVFDLSVAGRAVLSTGGRIEVPGATIGLGPARLEVSGSFAPGDGARRLELRAALPATPCNQVVDAVPPSVLGELAAFEWAGTMAGSMTLTVDEAAPADARLDLAVTDRCRFVDWPEGVALERFARPFVHAIELADGVPGVLVTGPGTPAWTPLEQVSRYLTWAVLAHEDAAFFRHDGFAPWAIETALQRNLEQGRFAYGASTVSMQLAKNLFLARDKTLARKLREAILTWWLEERLDKRRILELYLNVIEYGPGVYGVSEAAAHYFGRRPDELSLAESLFLANLLPSPARYHREYEAEKVRARTRDELEVLLAAMVRRDWVDGVARAQAAQEIEELQFFRGGHPGELQPRRPVEVRAAPLPRGAGSDLGASDRVVDFSWLARRPPSRQR